MNRNKSVGLSRKEGQNRPSNTNTRDPFDIMRMDDDFSDFDSMFNNFGGGFDIFRNFGSLSRKFDDLHKDMFSNFESISTHNMPGSTFIQKSYVSKVNYNDNGRPHKETYQSQSIKQIDREGKKIQEKQQAYQNTGTGLQKAAHERRFNDKGHKIVKERNRNTGEEIEHTLYKGISESKYYNNIQLIISDDYDNFDREYNDYRNKVNFQKNYEYLNSRRSLAADNVNINRRSSNHNQLNLNNNSNNYSNQRNYQALPDKYVPRR